MLKQFIIDLDQTIALLPDHSRDFINAKPNENLIAELRILKQKGWKLILVSARGDKRRGSKPFQSVKQDVEQEILGWLLKHCLLDLFDEIVIGKKRYGELYIDDKGICPEAFLAGIQDAKIWREFSQSTEFEQCIDRWLRNNALDELSELSQEMGSH